MLKQSLVQEKISDLTVGAGPNPVTATTGSTNTNIAHTPKVKIN